MQALDYPAAHSMDAHWFTVDEAGEVAVMCSGDNGPQPLHIPIQFDVFEIFPHLEKDEHGIAIFPLHYDPFAGGNQIEEVAQAFAALSLDAQTELHQLAMQQELSANDSRKFDFCKKHDVSSIVVLLNDAKDINLLLELQNSLKSSHDVLRLALDQPLYYLNHRAAYGRVWLLQKLRAIRFYKYKREMLSMFNLYDVQGFYKFEGETFHPNKHLQPQLCPAVEVPAPYIKEFTPNIARTALPASLRVASAKTTWGDGDKVGPMFVHLPGVRFASTDTLQLDESITCYDWGTLTFHPSRTKYLVLANMAIVHQEPSAERTTTIAQWHAAAEKGDALAQYSLGYLYCEGAEHDFDTAQAWFAKAASHPELNASTSEDIFANGAAAHFCYAQLLYLRLREATSIAPDELAQMEQWLVFAANKNCAEAQYRLGYCYAKGELLAQDLQQAKYWQQRLAAQDGSRTKWLLDELAKIEDAATRTQNE